MTSALAFSLADRIGELVSAAAGLLIAGLLAYLALLLARHGHGRDRRDGG